MITELEYLNALKIVVDYKQQLKTKNKLIKKSELLFTKSDKEIIKIIKPFYKGLVYVRYSALISLVKDFYFSEFNKKIGRNNSIEIIKELVNRKIIEVRGDYYHKEYYFNYER